MVIKIYIYLMWGNKQVWNDCFQLIQMGSSQLISSSSHLEASVLDLFKRLQNIHSYGPMCFPANVLVSFLFFFCCFFLFVFSVPAQLCSCLDCVSTEGQIAAKWSIRVTSVLLTVCTSGSFPSRWRQLQLNAKRWTSVGTVNQNSSGGALNLSWNFLVFDLGGF